MKFLSNLDLSLNELQNAKFQLLGTAPTGAEGRFYFDTSTTPGKLRYYSNSTWYDVVTNVTAGFAFGTFTDGTTNAIADTASDTFKLRSANNLLTVTVVSDDATHGDNALFTINQANIDHGSITGLGDDDHTRYVDITNARTITAVHTFSPSSATAPFILGANAQGQLVTGLNADRLDGAHASATPTASTIPIADGSNKLAAGWISEVIGLTDLTGVSATTGSGTTVMLNTAPTLVSSGGISLDAGSGRITNVADPTSAQDAATRAYVDAQVQAVAAGLDWKNSVRVATTANITLSGTQTIDGVAVVAGDRVLVKDQSSGSANGIYVVAAGAWTRATDADSSSEVTGGLSVWVTEGTTNGDTGWMLTNDTVTLGTTALTFTQFSGTGQITAGNGLTKTGNTLNVGAGTGLTANADDIALTGQALALHNLGSNGLIARTASGTVAARTVTGTAAQITITNGDGVSGNPTIGISATYAGQNTITTLGTVTTGTWNATEIAINKGGTGATTAAGARTNLSSTAFALPQKYAADIGDGSTTAIAVTHNLNTRDITVTIRDNSTNEVVFAEIVMTSVNAITVTFASAPASNAYRVIIVG